MDLVQQQQQHMQPAEQGDLLQNPNVEMPVLDRGDTQAQALSAQDYSTLSNQHEQHYQHDQQTQQMQLAAALGNPCLQLANAVGTNANGQQQGMLFSTVQQQEQIESANGLHTMGVGCNSGEGERDGFTNLFFTNSLTTPKFQISNRDNKSRA